MPILPALVGWQDAALTADRKTLWGFSLVEQGGLLQCARCHTTVTDCPGTGRGKLHLAIPAPARGTAEDAPGIPWDKDTVSSLPAAGSVWGLSPVLQARTGGRAGNVLEAAPAPAVVGPTFSMGTENLEKGDSCCAMTRHFLVFPAAAWLCSAQFNSAAAPSHTSHGAQNFHPVTVPAVQGLFLPCFPEELQGWCPPLHRVLVALVSPVPAPSPGPLRASVSSQGPLNKGFLGKLEKYFSAKAQTCSTSPPHSLQSSGFEGNRERSTDLSDPAFTTVFSHCYVSLSMARDEASLEPGKTKAVRGK